MYGMCFRSVRMCVLKGDVIGAIFWNGVGVWDVWVKSMCISKILFNCMFQVFFFIWLNVELSVSVFGCYVPLDIKLCTLTHTTKPL